MKQQDVESSLIVVTDALRNVGWEVLDSDYSGIFRKNNCVLFMNDKQEVPESFFYDASDVANIKQGITPNIKAVNVQEFVHFEQYNWHIEYDKFVLGFGKLPKTVGRIASNTATAKDLATMDAFVQKVNTIAENPQLMAQCNRANFKHVEEMVPKKKIVPYVGTCYDGKFIKAEGSVNFSAIRVHGEGFLVIPVTLTQKGNEMEIKTSISNERQPMSVLPEQIPQLLSAGFSLYEIDQDFELVYRDEWEIGDYNVTMHNPILEQFSDFNLDATEQQLLSTGLNSCYNVTPLLKETIDSTTMRGLLEFLKYDTNCTEIEGSYTYESLMSLLGVARAGYSIKKLANPIYSVERISDLFADMQAGFSQLEESLVAEGYDSSQIEFIKTVASKGKGIAHVRQKQPVHKLMLLDASKNGIHPVICEYLYKYGFAVNADTVKVSWDLVPENIQKVTLDLFSNLPDFSVSEGCTWKMFMQDFAKKINSLYFKKGYGILLENNYYFVGMDYNSVFVKDSSFSNVWNAMWINDKVIVNNSMQPSLDILL